MIIKKKYLTGMSEGNSPDDLMRRMALDFNMTALLAETTSAKKFNFNVGPLPKKQQEQLARHIKSAGFEVAKGEKGQITIKL